MGRTERGTGPEQLVPPAEGPLHGPSTERSRQRRRVLFLNAQRRMLAPQHIHAALARLLDRTRFTVRAAVSPECEGLAEWDRSVGTPAWVVPLGTSITLQAGFIRKAVAVLNSFRMLAGLLWIALRIRRDHIGILHTGTSNRDALGGLIVARLAPVRYVVHWHNLYWGSYPLVWLLGFRRADLILAVSEASRRSLLAMGVTAEKVRVLYNGIDVARYRACVGGEAVRRELGIAPEKCLVLAPGRLCPAKGQGDLVRATALLRDRGTAVVVLLVGRDDPTATPGGRSYAAELERVRHELRLEDLVRIIGHRDDMPAVLASADLVAVPSHDDPFPTVVLEAMACGKPVIGTWSGGIPEQIEDGVTGLLVPKGDTEALARGIERLADDPELRARLGCAARRCAEERFDERRMGEDASALFAELGQG